MAATESATVVRLEREVWRALLTGDADADRALLADDFLGVYATGFAGRSDHVDQLADGPAVAEYRLSDDHLTVISADAVLYSYRAEYRRPSPDEHDGWETMYVSSLWCRRDGRWVNTFSQDTAASTERPV